MTTARPMFSRRALRVPELCGRSHLFATPHSARPTPRLRDSASHSESYTPRLRATPPNREVNCCGRGPKTVQSGVCSVVSNFGRESVGQTASGKRQFRKERKFSSITARSFVITLSSHFYSATRPTIRLRTPKTPPKTPGSRLRRLRGVGLRTALELRSWDPTQRSNAPLRPLCRLENERTGGSSRGRLKEEEFSWP